MEKASNIEGEPLPGKISASRQQCLAEAVAPFGTTFTFFPHLPPELRIKIWEYAYTPRNIPISLYRFQKKHTYNPRVSVRSSLAHLLVSREAREIFLLHYHPIFKDFPRAKNVFYFNPLIDTLCMASGVKGLRYFLKRFPEDMKLATRMDVHPDGHALHNRRDFDWSDCKLQLRDLKDLELLNVRTIVPEVVPEIPKWVPCAWSKFEDTIESLRKGLTHEDGERHVVLTVQFEYMLDVYDDSAGTEILGWEIE